MATAPAYTAEAPPPPYHAPTDIVFVRRPRTERDVPASPTENLRPKWGIHAKHPYRLEVATLVLTVVAALLAIITTIVISQDCGTYHGHCDGPVFAVNLVLWPLTIAHSTIMIILMRISPAKIAAHRRPLHRPTPAYCLISSAILMCLWVAQGIGWIFQGTVGGGEDYGSFALFTMKQMLAYSVAFVQVLYLGFSSDALCGKDAVRRRRQRKADRRVAELGAEERMSEDVELGRVAVQGYGK